MRCRHVVDEIDAIAGGLAEDMQGLKRGTLILATRATALAAEIWSDDLAQAAA